ncbi:MAG: Sua5 family C-terminal domain-containing protein, partial [Oscillospiraceae bacterium]
KFYDFLKNENYNEIAALCFEDEINKLNFIKTINFGKINDEKTHANKIFNCLRKADTLGIKKLFVRCPNKDGIDLAVYNRLLRAAEFNVIKL